MPKLVTVKRDACGAYWISFASAAPALAPASGRMIGVDVGITDLAVTSEGWKSGQLIGLRAKAARLRHYQRQVSRRAKGSERHRKAKQRVARIHRQITQGRRDFVHQVSHRIASSARTVVIESLNVQGMLLNHHLARSLSDAALGELHRQLDYKVKRRGGTLIRVDR